MTILRPAIWLRVAAAAVVLVIATLASPTPASATAATPRASLTDIEQDVMCVSCREPLAVAQSAQADFERAFIRTLIARGETKPQIEQTLVAQYGPSVLGKPPASGFNLTVYILPPALLIAGAVMLAIALPRWRTRTRAATGASAAASAPRAVGPTLGAADARRLDEDLARFD
jgi:cytochrome c-type biogenesis protein CcmH